MWYVGTLRYIKPSVHSPYTSLYSTWWWKFYSKSVKIGGQICIFGDFLVYLSFIMARIASLDIHFHVNDIVMHLKVIYYHYYLYTGQYWFILHAKFAKIDKKWILNTQNCLFLDISTTKIDHNPNHLLSKISKVSHFIKIIWSIHF